MSVKKPYKIITTRKSTVLRDPKHVYIFADVKAPLYFWNLLYKITPSKNYTKILAEPSLASIDELREEDFYVPFHDFSREEDLAVGMFENNETPYFYSLNNRAYVSETKREIQGRLPFLNMNLQLFKKGDITSEEYMAMLPQNYITQKFVMFSAKALKDLGERSANNNKSFIREFCNDILKEVGYTMRASIQFPDDVAQKIMASEVPLRDKTYNVYCEQLNKNAPIGTAKLESKYGHLYSSIFIDDLFLISDWNKLVGGEAKPTMVTSRDPDGKLIFLMTLTSSDNSDNSVRY